MLAIAGAAVWSLQVEKLRPILSAMPGTGKQTTSHKYEPTYVFQRK